MEQFLTLMFFKSSLDFASSIYDGKIKLKEAKNDQYQMLRQLKVLEKYDPKNSHKINSKKETLINAKKCIITGIMSLRHLRTEFFRLKMDFEKKSQICLIKHDQIG